MRNTLNIVFCVVACFLLAYDLQSQILESDVKNYSQRIDLYDERGFAKNGNVNVDGKLAVSESNGGVSYVYPISRSAIDQYPLDVTLTYNGGVAVSSFAIHHALQTESSNQYYWERFSQNRPAWIIGVNGFAIQVLSTLTQFQCNPALRLTEPEPSKAYDDSHCVWAIDGYDFCNRMSQLDVYHENGCGNSDEIRLLRSDGSLLELHNTTTIRDISSDPENGCPSVELDGRDARLYTGYYIPVENNSSAYGIVEYDDTYWPDYLANNVDTRWHPYTRPRVLRYYTGDGLEYVFREVVAPNGTLPYFRTVYDQGPGIYDDYAYPYGHVDKGPTIFYLEEINSGTRNLTKFERSRHLPNREGGDISIGRALTTGFYGHTLTYGDNFVAVEAYGKTTKIKFRSIRSGERRPEEPKGIEQNQMPLATYGYDTPETAQRAMASRLAHETVVPPWTPAKDRSFATFYQSYIGLVTEVLDPEERPTVFEYDKYTREYRGFNFPNSRWNSQGASTLTLNNWRLKRVYEPTTQYDITYQDGVNNFQIINNVVDGYWSAYSGTSNVAQSLVKKDRKEGTTLSTLQYSITLLSSQQPYVNNYTGGFTQYDDPDLQDQDLATTSLRLAHHHSQDIAWRTNVQMTDNITNQVTKKEIFFHRYRIQMRREHSQDCDYHFWAWCEGGKAPMISLTIPRKTVVTTGTVTTTTIENYKFFAQNLYLPSYSKVTVKDGGGDEVIKALFTTTYTLTDPIRFPGEPDVASRYGRDIATQTSTVYRPDNNGDYQIYLKKVEEYRHLPLIESVKGVGIAKGPDTTWVQSQTQQLTAEERRSGIDGTHNVYDISTPDISDVVVYRWPPFFRLKTKEYTADQNDLVLAGGKYIYDENTDVFGTGAHRRGALIESRVLGQQTSGNPVPEMTVATNTYKTGMYPTFSNLLAKKTNALGAREEYFYNYKLPEFGGSYPTGKLLKNDGAIINKKLHNDFQLFETPLGKKIYIRKWNSQGALVDVSLRELYERTYYGAPYGLPQGAVDANGWYSHFAYDWLGRIKKAWLPRDFSSTSNGSVVNSKSLRLYGKSRKACRVFPASSNSCTPPTISNNEIIDSDRLWIGVAMREWIEIGYCNALYTEHSTGELLYKALSNDVIHQVGGDKKAYLRLFLTEATSGELTIKLSTQNPSFTSRMVIDNTVKKYQGTAATEGTTMSRKRQRSIPWDEDVPLALCSGSYYIYIPLSEELLVHMQSMTNNQELALSLELIGSGQVQFANDAEDTRPAIVVNGSFQTGPEISADDFTLAYKYDDCGVNSSFVFNKIDDISHTANPSIDFPGNNPLTGGNGNTRFFTTHYTLGADYKVKKMLKQGIETTFDYTGVGQLQNEVETATGYNTHTIYDELGRPLTLTHPDNTMLANSYEVNSPSAFSISDEYYGLCSKKITTDEKGIQTAQYYDAFDRLRKEVQDVQGEQITVTYEYDKLNRLVQVTNPKLQQTTYVYDEFGRVKSKSHVDLGTTSYAYDKLGNVRFSQSQKQHESNKLSFFQYDDLNRITVIGEATLRKENGEPLPSNPATRLSDWLDPNILHNAMMPEVLTANATMFLPTGNGGNPPVSFDPLDPDFLTFCDPADYQTNQRKTVDLLGEALPVGMDYLKHPASSFPIINTAYTSDPNLFENIAANAQFVQIGMWYDELPASVGGIWAHFPSNWNAMAPTGMIRNLKGRLAAMAYRSHGSEPYHFVVYSYDERGRVEAQLRFTENLGFDAMYYKYNSMDQVISVTTADPARQHTTWYATDNYGRIKEVSTALSAVNQGLIMSPGAPARYMYPTTGLSKPSSPDITYNYNNRGFVGTMGYPSIGTAVNYTYNSRAWLTSLIATDGSNNTIFSQSLDYNDPNTGYDGRGQIWGQTWQHGASPAVTQTYDYDNVRRLTEWEVDGRRKDSYFYDKVGNRQQMLDEFGVPTVYSYASGQNRMTGLTLPGEVGTMSYDANGAMTMREVRNGSNVVKEKETLEYTTDGLLRLYHRDVNNYNGGNTRQWYYRYSAAGEREQKRMSDMIYTGNVGLPAPDGESIWVYYMLGADGRQHAVYHGTKVQREVCFGGGVQILSAPYVYFYPTEYLSYGSGATANITMKRNVYSMWEKEYKIQDQLGSTRVVLNASGGVISQYDYEPFGKAQPGPGADQRLSFIDKEKDKESDLSDFGVRKYDDGVGRFMSIDPLWEQYRSLSPYHYSRNNPLVLQDPSGLAEFYNSSGFVGTDGVEDGDLYAVMDNVDIDAYRTDGVTDWESLKARSYRFPSESAREDIVAKVHGNIKPSNQDEDGGVVAIDANGNDTYVHGGKGEPHPERKVATATKAVQKAYDEAKKAGMTPTYYVHSHPSPLAFPGRLYNPPQEPSIMADYNSTVTLRIPGILITRENAIFFGSSPETKATIPIQYFKVHP